MRFLTLSAVLCATALAQPKDRGLEQWRASPARDLSNYQARDATLDPVTGRVAIHVNDAYFCGGSIISESYILTAAHCMEDAEFFTVMAGAHNIGEPSEPHRVEIFSDNGIPHPDYDSETLDNDIALIELPMPAPLNDYIKLACLPEKGDTVSEGDLASVTGWGAITNHSILHTDILHMVHDMPAITNEDCLRVYGILGPGAVCLSGEGGKGPCKGDSGGPMIRREGGYQAPGQIWTQHGVVSFGPGLGYGCQSGLPNGFTRTEYYLDWILSQIS